MKNIYVTTPLKLMQAALVAGTLLCTPVIGIAQSEAPALYKSIDRSQENSLLLNRSALVNATSSSIISTANAGTARVLPYHSKDYTAAANGSWEHSGFTEYTYTPSGQRSAIIYKSTANENRYTYTFAYDDQGNQTEVLWKEWRNDSWVTTEGNKFTYKYHANGKISQRILQVYRSDAWENSSGDVYSYDASARLGEINTYYWTEGKWELYDRERFTYTEEEVFPATVHHQFYEYGAWTEGDRKTGFIRNTEGEPLKYTLQAARNGVWSDVSRYTYEYDGFGGNIETVEEFINGSWVNERRTTSLKDKNSFHIEFKQERWTNNAWRVQNQTLYTISYSADGELAERTVKYLDTEKGTYVNMEKSEFGQLPTYLNNTFKKITASVYPNPAQSSIAIEADFAEATQMQLTDLTGKVVATKTFAAGAAPVQHIDLSTQAAGVYVLTLKNSKASFTTKVVKQ